MRPHAIPLQIDVARIDAFSPEAVLIDLDGTLLVDGCAVEGAAELVERYDGRCAVISNNSTDLPESIAHQLSAAGLSIPADRIYTAGILLAEAMAERSHTDAVFALASDDICNVACDLGARFADEAGVVAVGRYTRFDYKALRHAANLIRSGARLIASNLDGSHPSSHGTIVPETGALVAAIMTAAGSTEITVLGKPEPALALRALRDLETAAHRAVIVGDNATTDGAVAKAIGAGFALVGLMNRTSVSSAFLR